MINRCGVWNAAWRLWLAAAIGFALLPGCGKTDAPTPAAAVTGSGAANTPANAVVSGHLFKVIDGLELAAVKNQKMLHPQFELTPDDVDTEVIFGIVQNEEKHSSSPVILKHFAAGWRVVEVGELREQEWVHAAAGPAQNEVWGILDAAADQKLPQLTLLRSTDGGATWQYFSAVKKITPDAEYAGFSMSRSGLGRLTIHLEDDHDAVLHGYYHYATTDGGKTWTGPTMEADDTAEADSLKRFDTVEDAIKAADQAPAAGEGTPQR